MNEEKYVAFQESVKYPNDLMKDLRHIEKIESSYVELTFEINQNKYQIENSERYREYFIDRLNYVEWAVNELAKYSEEHFEAWLRERYVGDYKELFVGANKRLFENMMTQLKEIGSRTVIYKENLLKTENLKIGEHEKEIAPLEFGNIAQKLLLLESLGVLKAISETTGEQISSRKMGRILSDLLGTKDLTRHLRYFNPQSQPTDKNNPRTEKNLTALHKNLVRLNLPALENIVEIQLNEVMKKQD